MKLRRGRAHRRHHAEHLPDRHRPWRRNPYRRSRQSRSHSTLVLDHSEKATRPPPPSPSRTPRRRGRPPSPHTSASAFILPPRPAPSRKPPTGEARAQGIWGARTSPSGGFYCPRIPLLAHSSFARRVFLTEWMTQDSREPNCATVYLAVPPSCADGWKSSRCTRGGVGAGSSLLSRPVDRCKQFRGSPSIPQYLNALLQLKPPPPNAAP